MKKTIAFFLVLAMLTGFSTAALAQDEAAHAPSAEAIVLDVFFIRPLGIASLAAGTVFFIAALPFTLPSRSVGVAARRLVAEPFEFTFTRPVGENTALDSYYMESPLKK